MSKSNTQLSLWENPEQPEFSQRIRRVEYNGEIYFSLVDIMAEFSDTIAESRFYWRDTKKRLKRDGFQLYDKISQLKVRSGDGKFYKTDCATAKVCLRIIQSIPSPKAESIRQWLALVGHERLEEDADPELSQRRGHERAIARLMDRGLSFAEAEQWLEVRQEGKTYRRAITDEWQKRGAKGKDFATLTNTVTEVATGQSATEHSITLQLNQGEIVRDHLSAADNALIGATEFLAGGLHVTRDSQGTPELHEDIHDTEPMLNRDAVHQAFSKKRPNR